MYIIGIIGKGHASSYMPAPETVIGAEDHLMVLAHEETM